MSAEFLESCAQNHMATTFRFTAPPTLYPKKSVSSLLEKALGLVKQLEQELSEFLPQSPVSLLNAAAPGVQIPQPKSVIELLNLSERLRTVTQSEFNPWFRSRGLVTVPPIAWNSECAWRLDKGAHVGFGAIGKGYALDRVRSLLEREGLSSFYLSAGGSSLVLSGQPSRDAPWSWGWGVSSIGLNVKETMGIPFEHASTIPIAVGVSGEQEQPGHLGARQVHVRSSLAACASAAEADALSTALYVGGWDKAQTFDFSARPRAAMALIDGSGRPIWNQRFQELWGGIRAVDLDEFNCES